MTLLFYLLGLFALMAFCLIAYSFVFNALFHSFYPFRWKEELERLKEAEFTRGNYPKLWYKYKQYSSTNSQHIYFVDEKSFRLSNNEFLHRSLFVLTDPYMRYVYSRFVNYMEEEHREEINSPMHHNSRSEYLFTEIYPN